MSGNGGSSRARLAVVIILAFSFLVLAIHLFVLRPRMWPAGPGVALSGDTVFASASEPRAVPRIRPPDVGELLGTPILITRVVPNSEAARQGLAPGMTIGTFPADAESVLEIWAAMYRWTPEFTISVPAHSGPRALTLPRRTVWDLDTELRGVWMRQHLGTLLQMGAFLAGALILLVLGSRGMTATLVTLALIGTAVANAGPMFGAEYSLPVIGDLLLVFGWIVTPLSFPAIGLGVLYFPSRAPILDRFPWIYGAMALAVMPMLIISITAAAFLLGAAAARAPLAWFATHGWMFDASFAIALAINVAIVIEGIYRYRYNVDANERRRIQIVVYTGVAAVFAYALKAGIPLLTSLAGAPFELPWMIEAVLQAIVLLPAVSLPYAVAVKHVFSPRTVLRRSLQYALATRTLSVVVVLPIVALIVSLLSQPNRPLGDIIVGQPLFYAFSVALIALGWRYRNQAQRWLDRRFFRAEYDAREILVGLANRVPYETDPAQLVSVVLSQIDNALHPESIAVLAGEEARLEVVSALRTAPAPLPRDGGLATLLRWSDEPLEIFLDDERSPAARLPAVDRAWLTTAGGSLLVPIFTGTGDARSLVGVIALGEKRSEEPYTAEDRRLLSGIAAQMGVALDLSRLRRRASETVAEVQSGAAPGVYQRGEVASLRTPTLTPTMVSGPGSSAAPALLMCGACHRCYESPAIERRLDGTQHCQDDDEVLQPVLGMPPVVDGKYRIDAVIGRGGMGAVFRARDLRLERDVAIKIVRADLVGDPDSRARFRREAQIVAQLQHPAVVTVFDYGTLPDTAAFLVMEYVRGEDLRRVLKRERTLMPERAMSLLSGIAGGIDAAHRSGVLHRDLKPENILLPANGTGPKVLDFGVAKLADPGSGVANGTLTGRGTVVGTPAYMAPEQLRGESVDGRSDVYSLAVMTYEMLTGALPFGAGSFIDVGVRQAGGQGTLDMSGVPDALAPVLQRALALERSLRPASAGDFADQLRRALTR